MAIQLLGLRDKKGHAFFEHGWTAPSVEALFANAEKYIEQVPASERWNIFFTAHHCAGKEARDFTEQDIIAFDIDKIDTSKVEETARVVCEATGLEYNKTGLLCSGNGLWAFIKIDIPITDKKYFAENRELYKFICERINLGLKEAGLPGHADVTGFSYKKLARMPLTTNKKEGKADTEAYIVQSHIESYGWSLATACGAPNLGADASIDKEAWKVMGYPDTDYVQKECLFLKYSMDNQASLSEPEWYATLGIVGFLKNGRDLAHLYSKNHPGYNEVRTEFKYEMATKTTGPRTCKSVNDVWGGCHKCPHFGKCTTPLQLKSPEFIETEHHGFYKVTLTAKGSKAYHPQHEDLIKYYQKKKGPFFTPSRGNYFTYSREKKHWEITDEVVFKNFAYESFNPVARTHIVNEFANTVSHTKVKELSWMEQTTFRKLNMQNGILDMETGLLHAHSDNYGFMSILPYAYDEHAQAPVFSKFLNDLSCGDKSIANVLLEYMGYCLSGDEYRYHKALVLYGTGRNGKSTLNNMLARLVGPGYYSALNIDALNNDQHRAALAGKLFNIADENSPRKFLDADIFKVLSAGGEVTAKEVYKKPLIFRNRAKLIFNCNELPANSDKTHAFYERLLIVPFNNVFSSDDPRTDTRIEEKMLPELPGILNACLTAYKKVQNTGGFTIPATSREMLEEFREEQDEVGRWLSDYLIPKQGERVSLDEMYGSYIAFCERERNKYPKSRDGFGKVLANKLSGRKYTREAFGNRKQRLLYDYEIKRGF